MQKQDYKIHIIGAGLSGLIAATVLEKNGFAPVIIEATDRPGGRVKTDMVEGYQLDHGFQVLLTAYPAAKKYLNLKALDLQKFKPGAAIFKEGKQVVIGDPLRDISLLVHTLFSNLIPFSDKLNILKLNNRLKKKELEDIFSKKEQTTLSYLENFGFKQKTIDNFFKPFFSGIFLENKLATSSRMFEFIYKMFGEGYAALPKAGIEEIPKQLSQKLKNTNFKFNTKATSIKDGEIILEDGIILKSDFTIVATEASTLIANLSNQETQWKSCNTLYFEIESRIINKPLIGLVPKKGSLINNIFYHTSIETPIKPNKQLLSVTVVDNQNLPEKELINSVKEELIEQCGIKPGKLIKYFILPKSLPALNNLEYSLRPSETRITSQIFLAGDVLLNGSLNAAMIAGEAAALGIIETLAKKL